MSALRLARAATGRDSILKFAGAYHGHVDGLLADAGSGLATQGIPASPGVPAGAASATIVVPWNDAAAVEAAAQEHELAAILAEPYPANMGLVPPEPGFLEHLRAVADDTGALLVFDEVMRSISTPGMRRATSSASSTSPAVGAPKLVPASAARSTARTTSGCAWPWINGPQEHTQSTYRLPSTSKSSAPLPSAMKSGPRPIERMARTGEFTPPGSTRRARA